MQQVRLLFIALQFFTRLPIPSWVGFEANWLQHASRHFLLVGCVVAAIAAAVYFAAASIYLTGAFHEDGFADTCDGLGGGLAHARALEIMKDSRIGAYGAIGIVCMLATKLSEALLVCHAGTIRLLSHMRGAGSLEDAALAAARTPHRPAYGEIVVLEV